MSVPFRFTVGPGKQEFWMHRAIVAQQSPVLDRLVNGGFKEAQDLHAELEDVDEKTFYFFWQFAYTGDYGESYTTQEQPVQGPRSGRQNPSVEVSQPEAGTAWSTESSWMKFKDAANYANRPMLFPKLRTRYSNSLYTRNLFTSHARLYVFADCYQVSQLADVAFYRLGEALVVHGLKDNIRKGDVVNLLRYCFEEDTPEKLRDLMMLYVESKIQSLIKSTEFCSFLEDHGELSTALIRTLAGLSVSSPPSASSASSTSFTPSAIVVETVPEAETVGRHVGGIRLRSMRIGELLRRLRLILLARH